MRIILRRARWEGTHLARMHRMASRRVKGGCDRKWIGNQCFSAERNDLERSEAGFDKREWLRQILLGGHEPMQGWGEKSMSSPATRCALRKPLPATFRRLTYCSRRRRSDGGVHEYCCRIRTRHQSELCRDGEVIRTFLGCTHT